MRLLGIDIGGTSVKAALVEGECVTTGRSAEYAAPTAATLQRAIADAVPAGAQEAQALGLCVPGRLDPSRKHVAQSINVPGLENLSLVDLVSGAIGIRINPQVTSDAHAAAHDFWTAQRPTGRLLAISIGTGVGASVLDDGRPLHVSGETPGHLGQVDVTLDQNSEPRTLESYLGAKPLRSEFGEGLPEAIAGFHERSKPIRALACAIRIAHAIYRPDTVALLGFIGMQFASCRAVLDAVVRADLTPVAKPHWHLAFGSTPYHAAIGAARLASPSSAERAVEA